jgi:transposase
MDTLLNLPLVTVEHFADVDGYYVLNLRLLNPTISCIHCGQEVDRIQQINYILIRDLSISGRCVILKVPRRRFQCYYCHRFTTEDISFINWQYRCTKRYELWIAEQSKKMWNFLNF